MPMILGGDEWMRTNMETTMRIQLGQTTSGTGSMGSGKAQHETFVRECMTLYDSPFRCVRICEHYVSIEYGGGMPFTGITNGSID